MISAEQAYFQTLENLRRETDHQYRLLCEAIESSIIRKEFSVSVPVFITKENMYFLKNKGFSVIEEEKDFVISWDFRGIVYTDPYFIAKD